MLFIYYMQSLEWPHQKEKPTLWPRADKRLWLIECNQRCGLVGRFRKYFFLTPSGCRWHPRPLQPLGIFTEPHFLAFIRFLPAGQLEAAVWGSVSLSVRAARWAQLAFLWYLWQPWPTGGFFSIVWKARCTERATQRARDKLCFHRCDTFYISQTCFK